MSLSTMSIGGSDSIFSSNSLLGRLGNTAIDAFDKVAPVWLANELDLNERQPVAVAPTYQTTAQSQPTNNLTTTSGENQNPGFVVRRETMILVGGGIAVVAALLLLKE